MSAFGGLIMTNRGRILQAKAQTGIELKYTRFGLGDGTLGNSQIIELNALKHEVISLPIGKLKVSSGTAVVGSILNNNNISSGFYFREIGIFATDPDVGEILYCYGNAGNLAEYIPAGGGADVVEKAIDVQVLTGNAPNVTAVINQSLIFETPEGAQEKADAAFNDSKDYTDLKIADIDLSAFATTIQLTTHGADEAAHGIGNKATLLTTNKSSVVAAMNELFTNANDGKSDIASAIGSPATASNTFTQLKTHIQNAKNKGATNLTAKGTTASGTESLDSLMTKIASVNTGIKYATGTVTSGATQVPFTAGNGGALQLFPIAITGLPFKPSRIILLSKNIDEGQISIYDKNGISNNSNFGVATIFDSTSTSTNTHAVKETGNAYVNANSAQMPARSPNRIFIYHAFE